ncbi:hypothetical protein [Sphingomonas pruni]|uniref:hypothetical protein n=1 Tax=Sphingomonas pruni TaxID=40683 RepID=UPI0008302329|nr:hypothetical protein [Sphingomonas pruni]
MKTFKKRHQLFLPENLSRRLETIARNSGRARSEILVEALEAWLERRGSADASETVLARLTRIDRALLRLNGNGDLLWEAMSRLVRHQLITAANLPPVTENARAIGDKAHRAFLREIAERQGRDFPPSGND